MTLSNSPISRSSVDSTSTSQLLSYRVNRSINRKDASSPLQQHHTAEAASSVGNFSAAPRTTQREDELLNMRRSILMESLLEDDRQQNALLQDAAVRNRPARTSRVTLTSHKPHPSHHEEDAISLHMDDSDSISPEDSVSQISPHSQDDQHFTEDRMFVSGTKLHTSAANYQQDTFTASQSWTRPNPDAQRFAPTRPFLSETIPKSHHIDQIDSSLSNRLEKLKKLTDTMHKKAMHQAREKNVDVDSLLSSASSKAGGQDLDSVATSALLQLNPQAGGAPPSAIAPSAQQRLGGQHASRYNVTSTSTSSISDSMVSDRTHQLVNQMTDFLQHKTVEKKRSKRSSHIKSRRSKSTSRGKKILRTKPHQKHPSTPSSHHKRNNSSQASKHRANVATSILSEATTQLLQYNTDSKEPSTKHTPSHHHHRRDSVHSTSTLSKSATKSRKRRSNPLHELYNSVQEHMKHPAFSDYNSSLPSSSVSSVDTSELLAQPVPNPKTKLPQRTYSASSSNTSSAVYRSRTRAPAPSRPTYHQQSSTHPRPTRDTVRTYIDSSAQQQPDSSAPEDLIQKIREWGGWKNFKGADASEEKSAPTTGVSESKKSLLDKSAQHVETIERGCNTPAAGQRDSSVSAHPSTKKTDSPMHVPPPPSHHHTSIPKYSSFTGSSIHHSDHFHTPNSTSSTWKHTVQSSTEESNDDLPARPPQLSRGGGSKPGQPRQPLPSHTATEFVPTAQSSQRRGRSSSIHSDYRLNNSSVGAFTPVAQHKPVSMHNLSSSTDSRTFYSAAAARGDEWKHASSSHHSFTTAQEMKSTPRADSIRKQNEQNDTPVSVQLFQKDNAKTIVLELDSSGHDESTQQHTVKKVAQSGDSKKIEIKLVGEGEEKRQLSPDELVLSKQAFSRLISELTKSSIEEKQQLDFAGPLRAVLSKYSEQQQKGVASGRRNSISSSSLESSDLSFSLEGQEEKEDESGETIADVALRDIPRREEGENVAISVGE